MKLLERLEYWANTNGEKVAIIDNDGSRSTTYRQLQAMSDDVAERIRRNGTPQGSAILVRMARGVEYIAEEIGILKAQCAYVPLLMDYPDERVDYIRNDSVVIPAGTAMLVYTSGSTGRPKGVVYSIEAFESAVERMLPMMSDIDNLVFAAMAPQSFVSTLLEYWVTLSLGGTVHIISDDTRRDIVKLQDYLANHSITVANLVSRILPSYKNKDKALRRVFAGSERLVGCYDDTYQIVNLYGQSEGFLYSTFIVDRPYDNTPVGKPLSGVELKVYDEVGREVPQGDEGEICAIGVFPIQYQNMPELTAETFVSLPDGRTLVHTKDIGKILPDGNLLYVNRKDWMVKINGLRVEPGEVETVMKNSLPITDVVVKCFKTDAGQVFLAAFYTAEHELSISRISGELSKVLPDYMLPARFVYLEQFPLTVTGKVNRLALELPKIDRTEYVEPETEVESKLCKAFSKVLKEGTIGATDDFFSLGGDSISVLHLQNEVNVVGLTPNIIYKGRTPRGIAQLMSEHPSEDILGIAIADDREVYPMTSAQLAIYYQCYYNPEGTMYNNPFRIRLDADVDVERLTKAWLQVFSSHRVFKTEVCKDERGLPVFRPCDKINRDDLFSLDITDECMTFDFHHLIFDGTSLGIMLRELSMAYDGQTIEPEQTNTLALGIYEQLVADSAEYEHGHAIYREMFDGKECDTMIPYDMPETDEDDIPCQEFYLTIDGDYKTAIDALLAQKGVTANTLFVWAYQRTLSEVLDMQGVHFCTGYHGRTDARLHNAVGMMVRTVPLYFNIDKDNSLAQQLKDTDTILQSSIEASVYPYTKIADEFGLNYRNAFVYQGDEYTSLTLSGKQYPIVPLPVSSAQTDLMVMAFKYAESYDFRFCYRSDCYKESTIRAFAEAYIHRLKTLSVN